MGEPRGSAASRARAGASSGSPRVSATISGVKAIAQPSSALSSTGISTTMPRRRSGASDGDLERRVRAERRAAHHGLLDLEVVEQRDHLLAEIGIE